MARVPERLIAAVVVISACSACRASLDEVTYRCSRDRRIAPDGGTVSKGYPYVEDFGDEEGDDAIPTLRDRCWQPRDTTHANILESESDLIIRPNGRATWTATTRAPSLTQHIDRDFVFMTRAETVNDNGMAADHCMLGEGDVTGIVVRRDQQPAGWLTLTVRPFKPNPDNCVDEPKVPAPRAKVERSGHGLGLMAKPDFATDDVGSDGEADIAICRQGDALFTFYRDPPPPGATSEPRWQDLGDFVTIGAGSLEVGLTTASSGSPFVEGHFNWAVFQHIGTLPGDACSAVLDSFKTPPEK